MKNILLAIFAISLNLFIFVVPAHAASNPNLFVSAENNQFENHFSGSMVVEVVIRDNNIRDTDQGKGEPDVTINGKKLRMVQATDGNWYAYFANVDKAKIADSTVTEPGQSLDFGVICDRSTPASIFGISLSDTDGFSIPSSNCSGTPDPAMNNVVRKPRSINTNPLIPTGQIGLDPKAWPLIQLFSFSNDVIIQYNAAGGTQRVTLQYDDIPNISMITDRELYPANSEVFVTINDFQLNQDPTDEDSWTFNIESPVTTFYQAFDNNGQISSADGPGLVNLLPDISDLGFKKNGMFTINLNSILDLKSNSDQGETITSIDDDADDTTPPRYTKIVTFVERGPNSGIFENFDSNDKSIIQVSKNAPRGQTGTIQYNKDSISILTGSSTASLGLQKAELKIESNAHQLSPGTKYSLILNDPDQNINTNSRDHLDTFRDSSLIPTLRIGNPITLEKSFDVKFYLTSVDNLLTDGHDIVSSNPDKNSARLFIDASTSGLSNFEKISLNLGITSSQLRSLLIDNEDSSHVGTNWLNYDFRSIQNDLKITDFTDTSIELFIASLSSTPITLVKSGDISSSKGLIEIEDFVISEITDSAPVFIVINFDASDDTLNVGQIPSSVKRQPIILDFFSFGINSDSDGINNSIYRFELEETQDNSSSFKGTFEYAVANQINLLDSRFIQSLDTINDDIKFFVIGRMVDDDGIFISYSDLSKVGVDITTSTKSDIATHSGFVSTGSSSYRFGQPVIITLNDPDLNLKSDVIDIYHVLDDPTSASVDTVGKNNVTLLEVLIKDVRYKRCNIDGIEYGGLASTGFSLIETGPSTGIFEGVFKMPSKICDKSGTKLISPAGGSIEIKYHDSRDSSGKPNTFSSINYRQSSPSSTTSTPRLSTHQVLLPSSNSVEEIVLSGSVIGQKSGVPLSIILISPDGNDQTFSASITNSGNYRTIFSINSNSLPGKYDVVLEYAGRHIDTLSFVVLEKNIPAWIKNNAKLWSQSSISDLEFLDGIQYLLDESIFHIPPTEFGFTTEKNIPEWIKNNAQWWSNEQISDDDFINSIQYLVKKGIIKT